MVFTGHPTRETGRKTIRTNTQNKDARTDNQHTQEKQTHDRTNPKRQKRQEIKSVTHWKKITKQWQQAEDKRKMNAQCQRAREAQHHARERRAEAHGGFRAFRAWKP